MKRCPPDSAFQRLLQQQLSSQQTAALERHLETCQACCQRLDRLTDAASSPELEPLFRELSPSASGEFQWTGPQVTENAPAEAEPVPTIPGYQLIRELGRGGMGVVYQATQLSLKRPVALKVLLGNEFSGSVARRRFLAEAHAIARIRHPAIVQVYDFGTTPGGVPFLAMEYVAGGTLAECIGRTSESPKEIVRFMAELAEAIGNAHRLGIIHRDLKPSNILLTPRLQEPAPIIRGRQGDSELAAWSPKITDFGLVKTSVADGDPASLTSTGAILGTPAFMPPEQATGNLQNISAASDVYSLGAILYQMLTGRPPFTGSTAVETLLQVVTLEVPSPETLRRGLPADLVTVCLSCLAKDPADRYPNADLLAADLRRIEAGKPIRRKLKPIRVSKRAMIIGASAVILLTAAVSYWITSRGKPAETQVESAKASKERFVPIRVRNFSFEESKNKDNEVHAHTGEVLGWFFDMYENTQGGFWNPEEKSYPGSQGNEPAAGAHGSTILWLFADNPQAPLPRAWQQLETVVKAKTTYRLTVAVGHRSLDNSYSTTPGGYLLELMAGEDVLGSVRNTETLRVGAFRDIQLIVKPETIPSSTWGKPLRIQLSLTNPVIRAATDFDNVRLESMTESR